MVFQIKCCGFCLNLREPETSLETLMVSFIFFILDKMLEFSFQDIIHVQRNPGRIIVNNRKFLFCRNVVL